MGIQESNPLSEEAEKRVFHALTEMLAHRIACNTEYYGGEDRTLSDWLVAERIVQQNWEYFLGATQNFRYPTNMEEPELLAILEGNQDVQRREKTFGPVMWSLFLLYFRCPSNRNYVEGMEFYSCS